MTLGTSLGTMVAHLAPTKTDGTMRMQQALIEAAVACFEESVSNLRAFTAAET